MTQGVEFVRQTFHDKSFSRMDSLGESELPSESLQTRMLLSLGFLPLLIYGLRRKDWMGGLCAGAGLGGLFSVFFFRHFPEVLKMAVLPIIEMRRSVIVNVPVEVVFSFWANFSNYSRFMSYVQDVSVNEKQGFSWTVRGPAGIVLKWDSHVTSLVANQKIAWSSNPGAILKNDGEVLFHSSQVNETKINVRLNYAPPVGIIGYEAIRILGFDPRDRIDEDLKIMKTLVEEEYQRQSSVSYPIF